MSLEQLLQQLKERDLDDLESQKIKTEDTYKSLLPQIQRVAAIANMSEEMIVRCCVRVAQLYRSVRWYEALDIVGSFYLARTQLEAKQ